MNTSEEMVHDVLTRHGHRPEVKRFSCSFCGKQQVAVKRLVAGPACFICNECIELCVEIMADPGVPPHSYEGPSWSTYYMIPTWTMPRDHYEAQMAKYEWSD